MEFLRDVENSDIMIQDERISIVIGQILTILSKRLGIKYRICRNILRKFLYALLTGY